MLSLKYATWDNSLWFQGIALVRGYVHTFGIRFSLQSLHFIVHIKTSKRSIFWGKEICEATDFNCISAWDVRLTNKEHFYALLVLNYIQF